ncbi:MAG: hypothetical protein H0W86_06965 [Armatimonadetes bacterium]|nr:hypothetical protein [Armatimonadota bacterium]
MSGRLQASSAVDDPERADFGITIRNTIPTHVGPLTSKPVLQVDTSKAKRAGVSGAEIWVKIVGAQPVDFRSASTWRRTRRRRRRRTTTGPTLGRLRTTGLAG